MLIHNSAAVLSTGPSCTRHLPPWTSPKEKHWKILPIAKRMNDRTEMSCPRSSPQIPLREKNIIEKARGWYVRTKTCILDYVCLISRLSYSLSLYVFANFVSISHFLPLSVQVPISQFLISHTVSKILIFNTVLVTRYKPKKKRNIQNRNIFPTFLKCKIPKNNVIY